MARLAEELTTDFSLGMFDSAAATAYPSKAVAELYNARIQPDGTVRRRPGSQRTHSAALGGGAPSGFGAQAFVRADGRDQLLAMVGTQAYLSEDRGASWSEVSPKSDLDIPSGGVVADALDPASWTLQEGLGEVVSGITDPFGGSAAVLLKDNQSFYGEIRAVAGWTVTGDKYLIAVLAPGTLSAVRILVSNNYGSDFPANVEYEVIVTWNDGVTPPTLTSGEGSGSCNVTPTWIMDSAGRRWWVIPLIAEDVDHTAAGKSVAILSGESYLDYTPNGTVYVAGVEAWEADPDFTPPQPILAGGYYDFATMRIGATNYLFAANGDTTIKRWDGYWWDTVPNAPEGVKYIATFNSRLYATGHNGVIVQACKVADPTTWSSPDGLIVQTMTHSGDTPTGLHQVGPHLLVFNRRGISYIDGYGEETLVVATDATGFSQVVGCVAFRSIAGVGDNGVCWLSERGVEYYSPSNGIKLVSSPVQVFYSGLDLEELYNNPGRASAVYDALEQNYHLAVASAGYRNDRVLVLNLLQNVQYQRQGPTSAAAIDVLAPSDPGEIFFDGVDVDGYLAVGSAYGVQTDARGYLVLTTLPGDPLAADDDGYVVSLTNDTCPATLFIAPAEGQATVLYSLGYDGFVRRHSDAPRDDVLADGTGGTVFEVIVVSRPFLFRHPRRRKRVRGIHVASIQAAESTLTVLVRGSGGKTTTEREVIVPETDTRQAYRTVARTKIDADAPQVEVRSSDDVRLSLVGVSAALLRERF